MFGPRFTWCWADSSGWRLPGERRGGKAASGSRDIYLRCGRTDPGGAGAAIPGLSRPCPPAGSCTPSCPLPPSCSSGPGCLATEAPQLVMGSHPPYTCPKPATASLESACSPGTEQTPRPPAQRTAQTRRVPRECGLSGGGGCSHCPMSGQGSLCISPVLGQS